MITDYDSWHPEHGAVDISTIIATLTGNADHARGLVARLSEYLETERGLCRCGCDRALDFAVMTAPEKRDVELVKKLEAVAGRVL